MQSRNPVFNRTDGFKNGGYATFDTRGYGATQLEDMYAAPSATPLQTDRMTLDDVVVRTGMLFGALLVTASIAFFLLGPNPIVVFGSAMIGFVLALVAMNGKPKPALMFVYAAVEGLFVGSISSFYTAWRGDSIVPQAVLGTLVTFGIMLGLYKTGVIRNSPKFTKVLVIAGISYLVFGLLNLVMSMFHIGGWVSVYSGGGPLAIGISAFGVCLAALYLVLDFDFIENGVNRGLPRAYAWTAAMGLVVTLVWLYLEILRLIAILRGDD